MGIWTAAETHRMQTKRAENTHALLCDVNRMANPLTWKCCRRCLSFSILVKWNGCVREMHYEWTKKKKGVAKHAVVMVMPSVPVAYRHISILCSIVLWRMFRVRVSCIDGCDIISPLCATPLSLYINVLSISMHLANYYVCSLAFWLPLPHRDCPCESIEQWIPEKLQILLYAKCVRSGSSMVCMCVFARYL